MKFNARKFAALALAGSVAFGGLAVGTASAANAVAPSPEIIGGQQTNNPWAFQLINVLDWNTGKASGCTSEALNDHWVLTAKHCVVAEDGSKSKPENVFVVRTNDTSDISDASKRFFADQVLWYGSGDVALVHFADAANLSSYPQIAGAYTPTNGNAALIQGYGYRSEVPVEQADWLYKANVTVTGSSTDAYGGAAVHVKGVDGIANHGDSGGPLTIAGKIVGVASTIDRSNTTGDIHETANYANVTGSSVRTWISNNTGS
ncbi:S1 family peptidase [Psychromicrobium lacuslunae]|uniref:S1 family peptidase n=1 Tax=Psychromicrobium lacuslunae TaxID=1618207 RepID=UPI000696CE9D|nr:trypsin-like serine protease [Psychromicrobium lacuslunae]